MNSKPAIANAPKTKALVMVFANPVSEAKMKPQATSTPHKASPTNKAAQVRRKSAIVVLSMSLRALEMAAAASRKTAKASRKGTAPEGPLDAKARRADAIAEYSISVEVEGSTNRCLYRLARISVAECFGRFSAEE